jgi:hypothetical protein
MHSSSAPFVLHGPPISSSTTWTFYLTNSVALACERTIPKERPPLVGEVSALTSCSLVDGYQNFIRICRSHIHVLCKSKTATSSLDNIPLPGPPLPKTSWGGGGSRLTSHPRGPEKCHFPCNSMSPLWQLFWSHIWMGHLFLFCHHFHCFRLGSQFHTPYMT